MIVGVETACGEEQLVEGVAVEDRHVFEIYTEREGGVDARSHSAAVGQGRRESMLAVGCNDEAVVFYQPGGDVATDGGAGIAVAAVLLIG